MFHHSDSERSRRSEAAFCPGRAAAFFLAALVLLCCLGPRPAESATKDEFPSLSQAQAGTVTKALKLYDSGNAAQAASTLQDLMRGQKPHPYVCLVYGLALTAMQSHAAAENAFSLGLEQVPGSYTLTHNMAVALMGGGKYARAAQFFEKAASLLPEGAPQRSDLRYAAAQCLFRAKNYNGCLAMLASLMRLPSPKLEWVRLAAGVALSLERYAEAAEYFTLLTEAEPARPQNWKALAHVRLRQGNAAAASAALEMATRLPGAQNADCAALAHTYLNAGAPLLSSQALRDDDEKRVSHRLTCLLKAGRDSEALALLDAQAGSPDLLMRRGSLLYRMRRLAEARQSFASAAQAGEKTGAAKMMEGLIAWEQRDWSTARRIFSELLDSLRFGAQARQSIETLESLERAALEAQAAVTPDMALGLAHP